MDASTLCSLATVAPRGRAHINHMYFAWNDRFEVFWISNANAIHSLNLMRDGTAAVTIYDSRQVWGRPDRGIQLFGTAGLASGREAERVYSARFGEFVASENVLPFYRFKPRTVKLFDEVSLAPVTFVTARVTRDGLRWLKTEVSV